MQNKTNNAIQALEALINTTDAGNISHALQTSLIGYIITDHYCETGHDDRHNLVFAAGQAIEFS